MRSLNSDSEYFAFLDELRDSGKVDRMASSPEYLEYVLDLLADVAALMVVMLPELPEPKKHRK